MITPTSYRIVLGVSGGIAAYKAYELTRSFVKAGHSVQVVTTAHAEAFVTPLTFQALSGRVVRKDLFDTQHEAAMGHIELARWPDALVIAPATANLIAKLAMGMADDLLTTLCLATDKPIIVAPAMNRLMWANPATQANLATLKARGFIVLPPDSGAQACGEIGEGRLPEPAAIFSAVIAHLQQRAAQSTGALSGVRIAVTAGPTREPLDPVRFISNRSSGKQGYALASALAQRGASVTLISGPTQLQAPANVKLISVETAEQMLEASLSIAGQTDIFVSAAAIADYRAATVADAKIKKSGDEITLTLVKNPDVLVRLRHDYPKIFLVGFAAETHDLRLHALGKLQRKGLNMIAANWVGDGKAFDVDDNALQVFWHGGEHAIAQAHKIEIAQQLAELITQHYLFTRSC